MSLVRAKQQLPPRGRIRYSGVWRLYWVRLRRRWPQELLAILGIAVGVALLYSSQVASTSLAGPVKQLSQGIVGNSQLQLVARGQNGFPASVFDKVHALPGVRNAAPIVQSQGNMVGPRGARGITLFGSDPRIVRLRGSLLQGFAAGDAANQRTIVLPTPVADAIGVRFGDNARIQIDGRTRKVPVAVVGREQIGDLADTSIALAPLVYLQRLAGMDGRLSRVLVEVQPGQLAAVRERLVRVAAGRIDVVPADHETQLFDSAAAPTSQATTIFSVLSALVGFLFAFCAMLVSASGRRALALDLRRSGVRRPQVVRILLIDAAVLGVIAVAAGLTFGELLSRRGFGADVSFLSGAFPVGDQRIVTWSSVAIAAAGGMLAAALGVLVPMRHLIVSGTDREEGDRPADGADRARATLLVVGVTCLVAALVITAFVPGAAVVGLLLLAVALASLLPAILDLSIAALAWISGRARNGWIPVVELALQQLRSREWRVRSLAITMTGAIAVFGSVSLEGSRNNLQAGLDQVSLQLNHATDVWVSPDGTGGLLSTSAFAPTQTRRLAATPGVQGVDLYRSSFFDIVGRRAWVLAPPVGRTPAIPASQILDGDGPRTARLLRTGGWATVSRALSDALRLQVGERFTLPAPNPVPLRVAAITTNLGWSGGAIVLAPGDYVRGWGAGTISAYNVRLASGVAAGRGRQLVSRALGPDSALRAETARERSQRQQDSARSGLARLSQIATLTLLAAVLAMAAAIGGLLWQHRRMVARQKLDGHKTPRMWGALFVEAGTLIVTGCLAGALFALVGQVLCTRGVEAVTGFPVVQGLRLGVVAWSSLLVVAASLLVVAVPGYLVARVRPSLRD